MIKFECGKCRTKIKVPPVFGGKRVKCPGCAEPVRVPLDASLEASPSEDLSLLDALDDLDTSSVGPKKLRTLLVGCGGCGKAIKVPENRMGSAFDCPKCKSKLSVPRMNLPPTTGSTVDLKHIELQVIGEPSLLNDTMSGTQLGSSALIGGLGSLLAGSTGSGMQTSSGSMAAAGGSLAGGSVAGASGSGSGGGGATTSQEQMQQLRQLNDLRAEGAISDGEYRRRKAEIYASANLMARKAMSRGPGGNDQIVRINRRSPAIPGFAKILAVLAILACSGYAAWAYYLQDNWRSFLGMAANQVAIDQPPPQATTDVSNNASLFDPENEVATQLAGSAAVENEHTPQGRPVIETDRVMVRPGGRLADASFAPAGFGEAPTIDTVLPEEVINPLVDPTVLKVVRQGRVAVWPVMLPDDANASHPLSQAASIMKRIEHPTRGRALIAVGVGPAAKDLYDIEYIKYRDGIRQLLANNPAAWTGMTASNVSDRAARNINGANFQVWQASESRGSTSGRSIYLLTGVQNGFAVCYWFDGAGSLYTIFQKEVGSAIIEPLSKTP